MARTTTITSENRYFISLLFLGPKDIIFYTLKKYLLGKGLIRQIKGGIYKIPEKTIPPLW
jgi:hypothetical protein